MVDLLALISAIIAPAPPPNIGTPALGMARGVGTASFSVSSSPFSIRQHKSHGLVIDTEAEWLSASLNQKELGLNLELLCQTLGKFVHATLLQISHLYK